MAWPSLLHLVGGILGVGWDFGELSEVSCVGLAPPEWRILSIYTTTPRLSGVCLNGLSLAPTLFFQGLLTDS